MFHDLGGSVRGIANAKMPVAIAEKIGIDCATSTLFSAVNSVAQSSTTERIKTSDQSMRCILAPGSHGICSYRTVWI